MWFTRYAGAAHRWVVHGLIICVEDQAFRTTVFVVIAHTSVSPAAVTNGSEFPLEWNPLNMYASEWCPDRSGRAALSSAGAGVSLFRKASTSEKTERPPKARLIYMEIPGIRVCIHRFGYVTTKYLHTLEYMPRMSGATLVCRGITTVGSRNCRRVALYKYP